MNTEIERLVKENLEFHSLNKKIESKFGLSLVQYHLLSTLKDMPGSSPQQIANAIGMHPSTLTQSLKLLHRKNTIFVTDDPRDKRKKFLSITRHGYELLIRAACGIEALLSQNKSLKHSTKSCGN